MFPEPVMVLMSPTLENADPCTINIRMNTQFHFRRRSGIEGSKMSIHLRCLSRTCVFIKPISGACTAMT
jgi:hypothetical protein